MNQPARVFTVLQPVERRFQWGDIVVLLGVVVLVYAGVSLAAHTPFALRGPDISLAPAVLPYYAILSVGRMAAAYLLSLLVALLYGRAAAEHRRAEQVLLPLLDVLQSVPILSFLPVVLLSFSAVLPPRLAAELAAIVLIFTSQAWNLILAGINRSRPFPLSYGKPPPSIVSMAGYAFGRWNFPLRPSA
jgi:NitT/TauT family transport system permease protein